MSNSFWAEYSMFLLKLASFGLITILMLVVIIAIIALARQQKSSSQIEIENLNEDFENNKYNLLSKISDKKTIKNYKSEQKKLAKQTKSSSKPKLFVTKFNGDIQASAVTGLRKIISAIIIAKQPQDEVLVVLESPGGMVHNYGLAASQLARLRENNIKLTIAVDRVAASGGYMMACVGDKILAAPFAVVGSIGVFAQIPNFYNLLKKNDVDIEQHTAGEFKATMTMLGKIDDKKRAKFQQELVNTHDLFKKFINNYRPQVNIEKTATGEHWYGQEAIDLNLVDKIQTSDDFIMQNLNKFDVYKLSYKDKTGLKQKLGKMFGMLDSKVRGYLEYI